MAYLTDIPDQRCGKCRAKATKALHNLRNAVIGYYCSKCAPKALEAVQRTETWTA